MIVIGTFIGILLIACLAAFALWFHMGEIDKMQAVVNAAIEMHALHPRKTVRTKELFAAVEQLHQFKARDVCRRQRRRTVKLRLVRAA